MKYLLLLIICFPTMIAQDSTSWSERLRQKVETTTKSSFEVEDINLTEVSVSESDENNTPSKISENLYEVFSQSDFLGYIYVSQAPSMKNVYDYIVVFDRNFNLINTKVLIYREQHGRQIGTKRWLSQFFGMDPSDRPTLGDEIDGISGATISATSMTEAVNNLLTSVDYLKSHDFIK